MKRRRTAKAPNDRFTIIVHDPERLIVYKNDEAGIMLYSVCEPDSDYWLNSFKTREEAEAFIEYCKSGG
jgi:hypothetical protein